jgi:hypothetical protein
MYHPERKNIPKTLACPHEKKFSLLSSAYTKNPAGCKVQEEIMMGRCGTKNGQWLESWENLRVVVDCSVYKTVSRVSTKGLAVCLLKHTLLPCHRVEPVQCALDIVTLCRLSVFEDIGRVY